MGLAKNSNRGGTFKYHLAISYTMYGSVTTTTGHISYTVYGNVTTTPGIYPTQCMEVLLLPLAYILHNVWKCYYYHWHISYTVYGSVTTTTGIYPTQCMEVLLLPLAYILHSIYPTQCMEVLLLPLAYILHSVWKCYYYHWHISYTMYGSVTTTNGIYMKQCTIVLLL